MISLIGARADDFITKSHRTQHSVKADIYSLHSVFKNTIDEFEVVIKFVSDYFYLKRVKNIPMKYLIQIHKPFVFVNPVFDMALYM